MRSKFCIFALSAVLLAAGCAPVRVSDPLTAKVTKISDPLSAQLEFWHGLTDRKVVCNDDAFHGLLLFVDSTDTASDFSARVATLKNRKLIPAGFAGQADEAVTRGTVAFAVYQELHLHGGWVLSLFGPTPRYAMRELIDLNLFPRSSPEQTFSGNDFVGIIGRVEDFQDGESAFIPAQQLHTQPGD